LLIGEPGVFPTFNPKKILMEKISQKSPSQPLTWPQGKTWSLAGVVGSGNLEVLLEANSGSSDTVEFAVETPIPGYNDSWLASLEDFAAHYPLGGTKITIHDQGAPPIVVKLRLRQALDQLHNS
jgi:malonate decarboxylase delta subunit